MDQQPLLEDVDARLVDDQSHAAERRLFEQILGDLPLGDLYVTLLEEGWYWRDAAYIAWKGLPKEIRAPATLTELADMLGVSRRTINLRRQKNPAIDIRAAKMVVGERLFGRIDEVMEALLESATDSNYKAHPDRKLALEMAGVYVPKQGLVIEPGGQADDDLADASDEELRRLAAQGET